MSYLFRDQTSPQIEAAAAANALLILPIGTTEEHGPHLPVDTDARIAEAYGHGLAQALQDELPVLLMDTIRYGYSMQIMRQWGGTLIVRSRVFMDMVFDICKSALEMGFTKMALLDCHGHHAGALKTVSRELCDATDQAIAILSPAKLSAQAYNAVRKSPQGGSIHAGEWETSLVLHLAPERVYLDRASAADAMRYHSEFVAGDGFQGSQQVTWSTWYLQESQSGVYGDPTEATAELGERIMEAAVENGARFLREYWAFESPVSKARLR